MVAQTTPINPEANLAPDVYVIPDVQLADDEVRSWRLWEHEGQGPCLAIEIVAEVYCVAPRE